MTEAVSAAPGTAVQSAPDLTFTSAAPDKWTSAPSGPFSTTASDSFLDDHEVLTVHISFATITILYIPFILFNNNLVLWSTILFRKLHTPHNLMLASLAIADLIMGVYCIPMYALSYIPSTEHLVKSSGKYACLAWFASIELGGAGSLKNLLLITLDRFIAVEFSLSYNKIMTMKRAIVILTVLWLYVIVMTLIPFLGWNRYDPILTDPNERCNYYLTLPEGYVIWASFFTVTICISIPLLLNIKIIYTVCKQQRSMEKYKHLWSNRQVKRLRDRVQTVRITGILCLLFILFWLPYVLVGPLKYTKLAPREIEIVKVVVQLLYFMNSVVNAPIYALVRSEYKIAYYLLLTTPVWKWGSLRRHCLASDTPQVKPNKRSDVETVTEGTFQAPMAISPSTYQYSTGLAGIVKSVNERTANPAETRNGLHMAVLPDSGGYTNHVMVAAEVEETTLIVNPPENVQPYDGNPDVPDQRENSSAKQCNADINGQVVDLQPLDVLTTQQHQTTTTASTATTTTTTTIDGTAHGRRKPPEKDGNRLSVQNARKYIRTCSGKISPLSTEPQDRQANAELNEAKCDVSNHVDHYIRCYGDTDHQHGLYNSLFLCEKSVTDHKRICNCATEENCTATGDLAQQPMKAEDDAGVLPKENCFVRL